MSIDQSLVDKIQKLKTLAERAGTEGEMYAATTAINRLLLRHNLSMEEWEREVGTPSSVQRRDYLLSNSASWRSRLMHVVARANLCKIVIGWRGRVYVFGTKRNLDAAFDMFKWLEQWVEVSTGSLATEGMLMTSIRSYRNSYRLGMVTGISQALAESNNEIRMGDGASAALVPLMEQEVEAEAQRHFPNTKKQAKPRLSDVEAYYKGVQKGRDMSDHTRQLEP